jgi:hypothetical protein
MSKEEPEIKKTMEAMKLIYRNKGVELTDQELRFLAERHSIRDYLPQILLIFTVIVAVILLIWRFR